MNFDVIVIGGGPGGSTTASLLAGTYDKKVLLLEKEQFPRDKPCGDAISGKSMSVLAELGIKTNVENINPLKTHGVILSSPNGTVLDIPFKSKDPNRHSYGYVCKRFIYDNLLFQHARSIKNITTIEKFQASSLIFDGMQVVGVKGKDLSSNKEQEFYAKVIVGADGANGFVANKLGVGGLNEQHSVVAVRAYYDGVKDMKPAIEIHFVDSLIPGYFWIFPISETEANVGVGMITADMKKRRVNLQKAMFDIIANNALIAPRFKNAKMSSEIKGWNLPLGSKIRKCAGNGYVLVGDSASLIDPFSGEGIGNAMYSARLAARIINKAFEAGDFSESVLSEYERTLRAELSYELDISYKLQKLGQNKLLLNWVVGKAARSDHVRETLSGMLANTTAKKGLVNPLFYLKLLFA